MNLQRIKELLAMMNENDLSELEIAEGETRIVLKRAVTEKTPLPASYPPPFSVSGPLPSGFGSPAPAPATGPEKREDLVQITAPMVGTFYAAPSPNAEPFVEAGAKVEENTVICIIEAMKVMNEIKSEVKGTIKKVLVANGAAVEYDQPLFLVKPG